MVSALNKSAVIIGSVQSKSTYRADEAAMPSARPAIIDVTTNDAYTKLQNDVMLIVAMVADEDGNEMVIGVSVDGEPPEAGRSFAYSWCHKRHRGVAPKLSTVFISQ